MKFETFRSLPDGTVKQKTIFLSKPEIERIRNRAHVLTDKEISENEEKEKELKAKKMVFILILFCESEVILSVYNSNITTLFTYGIRI